MYLREFIENALPSKECICVLKALEAWHEEKLINKTAASLDFFVSLLSKKEFHWPEDCESPISINQKWRNQHNLEGFSLSFGIRLSTTRPKYATLGFLFQKRCILFRVLITENGKFIPEDPSDSRNKEFSYEEMIQNGIDYINRNQDTGYLYAHPLSLNKLSGAMDSLCGYRKMS
jgi:hypothetical protein